METSVKVGDEMTISLAPGFDLVGQVVAIDEKDGPVVEIGENKLRFVNREVSNVVRVYHRQWVRVDGGVA